MSAKPFDNDFDLYGMLCLAHKAFTCGCILYRLWRGIVGNKLQNNTLTHTSAECMHCKLSNFK